MVVRRAETRYQTLARSREGSGSSTSNTNRTLLRGQKKKGARIQQMFSSGENEHDRNSTGHSKPHAFDHHPNSLRRGAAPNDSVLDILRLFQAASTPVSCLEPSIPEQGVGFFLANFVQKPSIVPRGHLDFLPELLSKEYLHSAHGMDSSSIEAYKVLEASVTAAGLAALSTSSKSSQIRKHAQETYTRALRLTNAALSTPKTAVLDTTLIAVIILGMYENLRFDSSSSEYTFSQPSQNTTSSSQSPQQQALRPWTHHIRGACTLISLRGRDQLRTPLGHRIFQQFYGVVLLVACEAGDAFRVPEYITELWEENTRIGDYRSFGKQWTTEMIRLIASIIRCCEVLERGFARGDGTGNSGASHHQERRPEDVVREALRLDSEVEHIIRTMIPNIWRPEVVHLDCDPETVSKMDAEARSFIYGDYYHIHMDPWISSMWINFLTLRIMLNRTIVSQLALLEVSAAPNMPPSPEPTLNFNWTPETISRQTALSHQTTLSSARIICATTPQIIGQIPFPDLSSPSVTAYPPSSSPSSSAQFCFRFTYLSPSSSVSSFTPLSPLPSSLPTSSSSPPSPHPTAPAYSPETRFRDLFDPADAIFRLRRPGTHLDRNRPTGMHNLIWPLYQVAQAEWTAGNGGNEMKIWAREVLLFIAGRIGARQAVTVAEEISDVIKVTKEGGLEQ